MYRFTHKIDNERERAVQETGLASRCRAGPSGCRRAVAGPVQRRPPCGAYMKAAGPAAGLARRLSGAAVALGLHPPRFRSPRAIPASVRGFARVDARSNTRYRFSSRPRSKPCWLGKLSPVYNLEHVTLDVMSTCPESGSYWMATLSGGPWHFGRAAVSADIIECVNRKKGLLIEDVANSRSLGSMMMVSHSRGQSPITTATPDKALQVPTGPLDQRRYGQPQHGPDSLISSTRPGVGS
ncbi:hypothetical protein EVAR_14530_1 [Eumeta japonica]|uniref:Uncharacterized protein n=1 Tax=Eumeta variegata TaxID=151549 RepID=A0A4C1U416_EUMVA|nr:hypothetical protein EVAR_14530_1 [Eumeta japonica]